MKCKLILSKLFPALKCATQQKLIGLLQPGSKNVSTYALYFNGPFHSVHSISFRCFHSISIHSIPFHSIPSISVVPYHPPLFPPPPPLGRSIPFSPSVDPFYFFKSGFPFHKIHSIAFQFPFHCDLHSISVFDGGFNRPAHLHNTMEFSQLELWHALLHIRVDDATGQYKRPLPCEMATVQFCGNVHCKLLRKASAV